MLKLQFWNLILNLGIESRSWVLTLRYEKLVIFKEDVWFCSLLTSNFLLELRFSWMKLKLNRTQKSYLELLEIMLHICSKLDKKTLLYYSFVILWGTELGNLGNFRKLEKPCLFPVSLSLERFSECGQILWFLIILLFS